MSLYLGISISFLCIKPKGRVAPPANDFSANFSVCTKAANLTVRRPCHRHHYGATVINTVCHVIFFVTGQPRPDVRVHVPRIVVRVHGAGAAANPVVPILTANQRGEADAIYIDRLYRDWRLPVPLIRPPRILPTSSRRFDDVS